MSIHSDSANRALPTGADAVNVSVSEGGQQKTVERAGDAQTNSSTGRTTVSYNVKMKMDNGTERSFKITVGFTRDQLEAHLKGELEEGGGQLEDTIDKIVKRMKAEDIMKAAGNRISARLDDLDNATVTKLQGEGESRQLGELKANPETHSMAESISKVIDAFKTNDVGKLLFSTLGPQTSSTRSHSPPQGTGGGEAAHDPGFSVGHTIDGTGEHEGENADTSTLLTSGRADVDASDSGGEEESAVNDSGKKTTMQDEFEHTTPSKPAIKPSSQLGEHRETRKRSSSVDSQSGGADQQSVSQTRKRSSSEPTDPSKAKGEGESSVKDGVEQGSTRQTFTQIRPSQKAVKRPSSQLGGHRETRERSSSVDSLSGGADQQSVSQTRKRSSSEPTDPSKAKGEGGSGWQQMTPSSKRSGTPPPLGSQRLPPPKDLPPPTPSREGSQTQQQPSEGRILSPLPQDRRMAEISKLNKQLAATPLPPELKLPGSSDSGNSGATSEKKEVQSGVQPADGVVTGEDVSPPGGINDSTPIHTVLSSMVDFDIQEENSTTAETNRPRRQSLDALKRSGVEADIKKAMHMTQLQNQISGLDQKLTSKKKDGELATKTNIQAKDYQEAVSAILELEQASVNEISYRVVAPQEDTQEAAKGGVKTDAEAKPPVDESLESKIEKASKRTQHKTVIVDTSQLLLKIVQKGAGQKAIIDNPELFERVKNSCLKSIEKFSPQTAERLKAMPQQKNKEKVKFLKALFQERSNSTRYEAISDQLPVNEKNTTPLDTTGITFDYDTHPTYSSDGEEKTLADLDAELDTKLDSLTRNLESSTDQVETMKQIGNSLFRKELIAHKGNFNKAKASLEAKLEQAKGDEHETAKLEAALNAGTEIKIKETRQTKASQIIGEIYTTDINYAKGFASLTAKTWGKEGEKVTFYEHLHNKKEITDSELHFLQAQLYEAEEQAAQTLCDLAGISYDSNITPQENISKAESTINGDPENGHDPLSSEQKLQNCVNAFRSGRANAMMKPMAGMALKQNRTTDILGRVKKNKSGKELLDSFQLRTENRGLGPLSIAITPIQRSPRYVLLLQDLLKNAPPSARDQIETNLDNILRNTNIMNQQIKKT